MDLKKPEISASAFNYRELLIKKTLLIREQQPEINADNFSPRDASSVRRLLHQIFGWCSALMSIHVSYIVVGADVDISCWL